MLLTNQDAHKERAIREIRQRNDALVGMEGNLCAARIAEVALYAQARLGSNSLQGAHAREMDELRTRASEEVQRPEAEVGVHEEVLQRHT